jgi:sugar (pentulose or hexulose) kinase
MLFGGIDIGTQSVKFMIINEDGKVEASASCILGKSNFFQNPQGMECHEQDSLDWWRAVIETGKSIASQLNKSNILSIEKISGICVTGTSGTMVPIDAGGNPLNPAIMYNDNRAVIEAKEINEIATKHCARHGYQFAASFGLPKIRWLQRNLPDMWKKTTKVLHCADFIVGKLTGKFGISDYSNALKTGYDLLDLRWPTFIKTSLDIPEAVLPKVLVPGDFIANTTAEFSKLTGLSSAIAVFAGVTDSTASVLSAGAVNTGDILSVLGSTIVEKAISPSIVNDPQGRIYSHRLPYGGWIPGGAGNTGALILTENFGVKALPDLDSQVMAQIPSRRIVYPLLHQGERFPFVNAYARGFEIGEFSSQIHKYTAYLEGLCFTERMMTDVFIELGMKLGDDVYSVGGATKSAPWMQLRASILNKIVKVPEIPEAAFGCALLVGCSTEYEHNLKHACDELITITHQYEPKPSQQAEYEPFYHDFVRIIHEKQESEWLAKK